MAITAKEVMSLRQRTGLGMMECKKALAESAGDVEEAIKLLVERVGGKIDQRTAEAAEGLVAAVVSDGAVAMTELRSETDFAARNDMFVEGARKIAQLALAGPDGQQEPTDAMQEVVTDLRLSIKENISVGRVVRISGPKVGHYVHHTGKMGAAVAGEGDLSDDLLRGICQHLSAADGKGALAQPLAVDSDSLPADRLEEARSTAVAEAKAAGKPPEIAEKIVEGKLRKWTNDHTLLGQIYVREMDAKKPIRDYIPDGAKLVAFTRFEVGG